LSSVKLIFPKFQLLHIFETHRRRHLVVIFINQKLLRVENKGIQALELRSEPSGSKVSHLLTFEIHEFVIVNKWLTFDPLGSERNSKA